MTELSDREKRWHGAFDPNFKFPPIVRPSESVETTMARVSAAADLAMQECPYCNMHRELLAMDGALPRAVGLTHEPGCPNYVQ